MRRSLFRRIVGVGVAVAASASVVLSAAPAHAGPNTDVITAAGSDTTMTVMGKILNADGTAGKTFNILAGDSQNTPLTVPADGFCLAHTYEGQAASNTWPNQTATQITNNWVPAPNGTFSLYLRAYWADQAILDGTWQPPKIEKVN